MQPVSRIADRKAHHRSASEERKLINKETDMSDKILVTGASGQLGRATLLHLLERRPASQLVGLVRDPGKAPDLADKGIELRQGDYLDYDSLVRAFADVEKLLLVSAMAFTDRITSHYNAITAARQAGVKHIVYTAVARRADSSFVLPQVTEPDIFTEQTLKASGVPYTIAAQGPFLDTLGLLIGSAALDHGIRVPAGSEKIAAVSRSDLGEAQAIILTEAGHENKTYNLNSGAGESFADIARIISAARGKDVQVVPVTDQQWIDEKTRMGFPEPAAAFFLSWAQAMVSGEFSTASDDLERLIGRKPTSMQAYLEAHYRENGAQQG
jgi:NAD(P)H dehydrogenase (quinone)